jgi:hypothetical protein
MRDHESWSVTTTRARGISMLAALLLSSAAVTQRAIAQETAPAQPPDSATDITRSDSSPVSVRDAQRIRRVIANGTHVVLNDGTVWEVYLPDRPAVDTWRPGDLLVVREAPVMQGEYDYTLKDGRTRKPVWVRLVGELSSRS